MNSNPLTEVEQPTTATPSRFHSFFLKNDEKKTVTLLFKLTNHEGKLYSTGDVIWVNKGDNADDMDAKSVRCTVTLITDTHTFYKEDRKYILETKYFLKESTAEYNFEGYEWSFPNPFDKNDEGKIESQN